SQAPQRLLLDLPRPLRRDAQLLARIAEAECSPAVQAVAQLDHLALALAEAREGVLDLARDGLLDDLFLGAGDLAGHEVAERGLAIRAQRLVEARDDIGQRPHVVDLFDLELDRFGELLERGLTAEAR